MVTTAATAKVTMTPDTAPKPYIEKLLKTDRWRGETTTGPQELCSGPLVWDGSPYWMCTRCGRVSNLKYDKHTMPPRFQKRTKKATK